MSEQLTFPDEQGYADLVTFVRRARSADPDGAVRLHGRGSVLAVWAAVLPGSGLFGDGAALGVRGYDLAHPSTIDVVVSSASLADRFARDEVGPALAVPPATVHAAWTGSLPDGGWAPVGEVSSPVLDTAAREGIERLAEAARPGPAGALAVAKAREAVWGSVIPDTPDVPAAAAFAGYVLGLIAGDAPPVPVYRSGRWLRLRGAQGHVIVRC